MGRQKTTDKFDVWRLEDVAGIELRSGVAVKEPYPNHWHDEYQFCFIEDGGGELFYRGKSHKTPKLSLFVVHPGEVHSNSTNSGCSFRSIYIEPEVIRNTFQDLNGAPNALPFFADTMIFDREIIDSYLKLHLSLENSDTTLERETALLDMVSNLIDRFAQDPLGTKEYKRENKAIELVRDYIAQNYSKNISLKTLSEITNLSRYHINRIFSEQIGMPPHAFQNQVRIARAKKLLKKGTSLSNVAATIGFADQSHFTRHFKRLMKITPGEY